MRRGWAAAAIVFATVAAARADDAPPAASTPPAPVETRHTMRLGPRSLDYRALVETIGLTDAKQAPTAAVYTVAYLADPVGGAARPVTFVFNGGPGAASVFLHLGALGPKIMETAASGALLPPPVKLIDNPSTWLGFTDLVFVDPVGTGFSRSEGKQDNPNKRFWNVEGDIESLDSVVRLWLTRHKRWSDPVYLVGESYGGFRVGAMAKSLARDEGITVNGLVMVSPALDPLIVNGDIVGLVAGSTSLPSFAATAAALTGKTGFDPGLVENFALTDYLVGLATMKGVPPPGDPFIAKVAQTIGLPADIVRRERGWVSSSVFAHELRRDQNEVLSLYDGTITRPSPGNPWDQTAGDPVLDGSIAAYTAAFNAYAPEGLGYHTDLQYRVLPRNISHEWDFTASRKGEDGLGLALSGLQTVLLEHPATKVLVVNGRYDLVTPYFASRWLIDQLAVPEKVREAVRVRVYDGGHMMYLRPSSREAFNADAAALYGAGPGQ